MQVLVFGKWYYVAFPVDPFKGLSAGSLPAASFLASRLAPCHHLSFPGSCCSRHVAGGQGGGTLADWFEVRERVHMMAVDAQWGSGIASFKKRHRRPKAIM